MPAESQTDTPSDPWAVEGKAPLLPVAGAVLLGFSALALLFSLAS